MHVLMLGWEFPPFITGGLGTACHGLTRALDRRDTRVTFVLPKAAGSESAAHVRIVSPQTTPRAAGAAMDAGAAEGAGDEAGSFEHVRFIGIEAGFVSPYQDRPGAIPVGGGTTPAGLRGAGWRGDDVGFAGDADAPGEAGVEDVGLPPPSSGAGGFDYGGDLIGQVSHYARFCLDTCRHLDFDVIHAHDWMTYPAGLYLARATGRPLVVHVHSTEFDRSGEHVNQRIYDIERRGMHGAMRVITVSQLTGNVAVSRYGVPASHVDVVYNGVDLELDDAGITGIERKDKIVLYFGRITYQKGPEYFVRAAKRVLDVMDDVKFVVAGSGDQARSMIEMAAAMNIGHKVLFTGFLRGRDIKRVFSIADLYVMPSISEPFGIAPLEAMSHDVPVLISKSSGVSEVLMHALKVDFWDVDDMANKIVAVLRHPPLSHTLREHGAMEVRKITWDGAAERCEQIYRRVIAEVSGPAPTVMA